MLVTKADGSVEEFDPNKLRTSLRKAGAHSSEIEEIVSKIEGMLTDGIKTQTIYRKAFEFLRNNEQPTAAKYSLRRALLGLGPTGFPFEDFLARLFEAEGFKTKVRITVKGKCTNHEIDVAAYSPDYSFITEAKFHSNPGIKSDVQVVMYSYARLLDVRSHPVCEDDHCGISDLYIVTNTKFTRTAIDYAECTGVKLLSWGYPDENPLQARIENAGLYPITALTTISTTYKRTLLEQGIVLCRDIVKNPDVLSKAGMRHLKKEKALEEARMLCKGSK